MCMYRLIDILSRRALLPAGSTRRCRVAILTFYLPSHAWLGEGTLSLPALLVGCLFVCGWGTQNE